MVNAARASAPRTTSPPSRIQPLAKYNRKLLQLAENKHQRSKSIASFCRILASAPRLSSHASRIAPFLFDTNERTRKKPNLLTTNKKTVHIRYFERFSAVLFDTFERSFSYPLHFAMYPFLRLARHDRIAAL
jgi:hypothetical protein